MPECAIPPRCEFVLDGKRCPNQAVTGTVPRRCAAHANVGAAKETPKG